MTCLLDFRKTILQKSFQPLKAMIIYLIRIRKKNQLTKFYSFNKICKKIETLKQSTENDVINGDEQQFDNVSDTTHDSES